MKIQLKSLFIFGILSLSTGLADTSTEMLYRFSKEAHRQEQLGEKNTIHTTSQGASSCALAAQKSLHDDSVTQGQRGSGTAQLAR